jgi:hypothetical protein
MQSRLGYFRPEYGLSRASIFRLTTAVLSLYLRFVPRGQQAAFVETLYESPWIVLLARPTDALVCSRPSDPRVRVANACAPGRTTASEPQWQMRAPSSRPRDTDPGGKCVRTDGRQPSLGTWMVLWRWA